MKLFKYGIVLKRITRQDIELVRLYRNAEEIQRFMHYREHITRKMQKKWFKQIDNIYNFYYLVYYYGEPIGLFNEKNINWEERTSETGLMLWDARYVDTQVPLMISLMLSEVGFYVMQGKRSYVEVLSCNRKAAQYAINLGYRICEGQEGKELQRYELTRELFEQKGARLLDKLNCIYKSTNKFSMLLEPNDYKKGIAQHLENVIKDSPFPIERKEDVQGVWFSFAEENKI
jgi:diamine N-acetyltransferase